MPGAADAVGAARRIGEEVLFPHALATDAADSVPRAHLDLLADAGLYGLAGPEEAGGLAADLPTVCAVVEVLAGACLATAFVWVQHHRLVRALATAAPPGLRAEWLGPLCRGERRAGVALGGTLPGPPRLTARPARGAWVLDGESPWVTGWGRVDVLHVAARGPDDTLVWLLVDAAEGHGLTARRQRLVAVDASATVSLALAGLEVPGARVVDVQPYDATAAAPGAPLRVNGSLALGVAGRCCRLLGPGPLDGELEACRRRLDEASPASMAGARAAASELALRAAATLVVSEGSRSVTRDHHAQRLAREALFLLVFGTRPPIRAALLERLSPPAGAGRGDPR